jgi:glycerol-3-phosphate dehydrogenase
MEFGIEQRKILEGRLESETFDLLVVGGGITGAGIAREAVLRGLKTALVEKDDFAFGTSSRSSKLVHGGLRYLEQYDFGLVFESTQERSTLMRLARHVVRPLPFIMPVFRESRRGLFIIDLGLWLYDILGTFRNYRNHRKLSARDVLELEPRVRRDGLKGGVFYYDAGTDDSRLTLENVLDAAAEGAVTLSRVEARGIEFRNGRVHAVQVFDSIRDHAFPVRTRAVVCAAGPWTGEAMARLDPGGKPLRLRPTKGAHIVLPASVLSVKHAIVMLSPRDGRVMFAIPWHAGTTLVGTTDTDFDGNPDEVYADASDVDYLLETVRATFPDVRATPDDIVGTWAGVRPLIHTDGVSESQVSREHHIASDPRGVVTISGGKLTTYRIMARQAVDAALPFLDGVRAGPSATTRRPLPYCCSSLCSEADLEARIDTCTADHGIRLVHAYGKAACDVMALVLRDRSLLEPIVPGLPYLRAEVPFACRSEMALTLEDVMCRRLPIFYLLRDGGLCAADDVTALMAPLLGWDDARRASEKARLAALADRHLACVRSPAPKAT